MNYRFRPIWLDEFSREIFQSKSAKTSYGSVRKFLPSISYLIKPAQNRSDLVFWMALVNDLAESLDAVRQRSGAIGKLKAMFRPNILIDAVQQEWLRRIENQSLAGKISMYRAKLEELREELEKLSLENETLSTQVEVLRADNEKLTAQIEVVELDNEMKKEGIAMKASIGERKEGETGRPESLKAPTSLE